MRHENALALRQLNRSFYQQHAPSFDQARRYAWRGWTRLLPFLRALTLKHRPVRPLRVLDLGCGNARFFGFLVNAGVPIDYVGVDESSALLALAHKNCQAVLKDQGKRAASRFAFVQADVLQDWQALRLDNLDTAYDLIVVFGLLHHVPGAVARMRLVAALPALIAEHGILCLSFWRFAQSQRVRERILPWAHSDLPMNEHDAEVGDFLVQWGQRSTGAMRYCHSFCDEEIEVLRNIARHVTGATMREIAHYSELSGQVERDTAHNDYVVLTRTNEGHF